MGFLIPSIIPTSKTESVVTMIFAYNKDAAVVREPSTLHRTCLGLSDSQSGSSLPYGSAVDELYSCVSCSLS